MSSTLGAYDDEVQRMFLTSTLAVLKMSGMDWDLAQLRAYAATVDHGSLDGGRSGRCT